MASPIATPAKHIKSLYDMKLDQLIILLPCPSLEDLSLQRDADDAEQLLSAWSALWHPALLRSARQMPSWLPAEEPPQEPAGHLVIVPRCSAAMLPEQWLEGAESAGACVIRDVQQRRQMVALALERLDESPAAADPDLVADFLALGFAHLQVELLTRQLRYMSNLDEETFQAETLAAAEDALNGDGQSARQRLQSAFDLLHQAREYFYPVEAHLLDLTLVARTTLGKSLRDELAGDVPSNLLISGEVIEEMARREPETLKVLNEMLERNAAGIIGGESDERALPLLTPEAVLHHLRTGLDSYQKHLRARPTVFGRRRFGLTPVLPQILERLGFVGAIHATLDDGRFPTGNQSRIRWEGVDGTVIETVARVPIDVTRADAFLRLPERLGNLMDLDNVATLVFAHWPGQSSRWYRDLKRIAAYSPVIGTFTTINDYFDQTGMSGQQTKNRADQYRSPYLKQAVTGRRADPISRWVRYYRRRAVVEAAQTLHVLATLAVGDLAGKTSPAEQLLDDVENSRSAEPNTLHDLDRRLQAALGDTLTRFCQSLGGHEEPGEKGYLVANPWSFPRRLCLEMPELEKSPDVAGAVRAVGKESVLVDLPATGFAWVGPGKGISKPSEPEGKKRKTRPNHDLTLAEENLLQNEFFEVAIDPHTGAIRAISDFYGRGPRLAQQIALRTPKPGQHDQADDLHYSIMAADKIAVTSAGPLLGEIVCRGRLVDREGKRVAGFSQTTRVRRGIRVIELLIELDIEQAPRPRPWDSYYAARFAWADPTSNLYRGVNLANLPTDVVQVEAPHFIDIRSGKVRTTLLTGGLPYHRRFGLRKMDTLLVVHGETARSFRLGIGIDLRNPVPAALDFIAPQTMLLGGRRPPSASGWLFHLDVRNVVATHWEPLLKDRRVEGFRVRLLETDGRKVRLGLRCLRPVASAERINPGDAAPTELPVEGDRVTIQMGPHQWVEVEARFVA